MSSVLPSSVQFICSLNWASGLIPLGRLYLRPLQRYLHSLGLTDWFTPPRRSDLLVLASLLQQWQDLSFLTSGIPIRLFQAEFTIFTDASTQGCGAYMGDSQISGTWTPQDHKLHINCLELKAVGGCPTSLGSSAPGPPGLDCYGQFDSSFIYQQARRDPFPYLASSSRSFYVVTSSQHSSPSKTHSGLSKHDSRPPISSQSADIDSVESPPRNRESDFLILGDSSSGHVCHCLKFLSSSVHASNSGAHEHWWWMLCLKTGREGTSTCFHLIPCSAKLFRNYSPCRRQK